MTGACATIAAAALSALASSLVASAQADELPALTCSVCTLAVRIADPGSADHFLWGQLCYRGGREPGAVRLLMRGAGYNHLYWNFPYANGHYSYVNAATAAGYATFDIDRVGDSRNRHPPSAELDLNAGAMALHDAVTALRSGAVDGHAFQHVITVGHSIGSSEVWIEAARYHDVDAVIIAGALHAISPDIAAFGTGLYSAADDPTFAGSGLDSGRLTTLPGTRESLFYGSAAADPVVVAAGEASKDTATPAELGGAEQFLAGPPAQQPSCQVTVSVLVAVGKDDNLFCAGATAYKCASTASVSSFESQYYAPAAHLRLGVIPGTGHDLALSTTAPVTDAITTGWALSTVEP